MWAGRTLAGTDRFGRWVTTALDGWWDSPDVQGETISRSNADGEYDLPIYNQARFLTVTGTLRTTSHDLTHEGMNFLTGPIAGRLQVAGHGNLQWAEAKRNGGVKFTPLTDTLSQWQVRLKCVNPLKYGDAQQVAGVTGTGFYLNHFGNYPASPVFSITGDMPSGYRIDSGGLEHRVDRPLAPGSTHFIDFRNGLLRENGGYVNGGAGRVTPFKVPPGSARLFLVQALGGSGSGNIAATLYDTYI